MWPHVSIVVVACCFFSVLSPGKRLPAGPDTRKHQPYDLFFECAHSDSWIECGSSEENSVQKCDVGDVAVAIVTAKWKIVHDKNADVIPHIFRYA